MNTKYISSNVLKTLAFSRVQSTNKNDYVFNTGDEIFFIFTEKKKSVNFLFILYSKETFA